jgi:hypothetical protein
LALDPGHRGHHRAVAIDGVAGAASQRRWAGGYRATSAHALAYHRASRPKPAKLLTNLRLRTAVYAVTPKKPVRLRSST